MRSTGYLQKDGLDAIKTIGGELYGIWTTRKTKKEAQREADRIRIMFAPVNVRIRKFSHGWAIYRRNG